MKTKFGVIIILTGFAVGAISYWPILYDKIDFLSVFSWIIFGVLSFAGGFFCRLFMKVLPMRIGIYLAIGVVLAVCSRILYDGIFLDTSAHNLAPLEIIFAIIQTLPMAFLGAYIAKGLKGSKK